MIELPADIHDALDFINFTSDERIRRMAYKLLSGKVERYGLRWEWFV